jgi:3-oxoacyl-[acyl-carrier-protein] synthase-3
VSAGLVDIAVSTAGAVIPNSHFDVIGLTDEWIQRRTGIVSRRWFDPALELAEPATAVCQLIASRTDSPIGALVLVSTSSTQRVPPLAPAVATAAGLSPAALVFDLNAACSGFVHGLATALALVDAGTVGSALVCCVEAMSRLLDPADRQTACLFGDGAAAVLVAPGDFAPAVSVTGSDGAHADIMRRLDPIGLHLDGLTVFNRGVRRMSELIRKLAATGPTPTAVIPHQANGRILNAVRETVADLGLTVVNRIAETANTSSASIPLALGAELEAGALPPTGRLVTVAYGAGETWGGVAVDYAIGPAGSSR